MEDMKEKGNASGRKKSRIRKTKHLLTDADGSTNTKKILLEHQNWSKSVFLHGNFTRFMRKSIQI